MKMNFKKVLASAISLLTIMSTNSFVFSMDSVSDANEIKEATSSASQGNEDEIVKDKGDQEITVFEDGTDLNRKISVPVKKGKNELLDSDNKIVTCVVCRQPIVTDEVILFKCKNIFGNNDSSRNILMSILNHAMHRDCAKLWYKEKGTCPCCKVDGSNGFYYLTRFINKPKSLGELQLNLYGSDQKIKFLFVPISLSYSLSPKYCSNRDCGRLLGSNTPFALYECSKKLFDKNGLTRQSYKDLLPHAVCLNCFRTNLNETDTDVQNEDYNKDARFRCPECEKKGEYKKKYGDYGFEDNFATLVSPEQKADDLDFILLKNHLINRLSDSDEI